MQRQQVAPIELSALNDHLYQSSDALPYSYQQRERPSQPILSKNKYNNKYLNQYAQDFQHMQANHSAERYDKGGKEYLRRKQEITADFSDGQPMTRSPLLANYPSSQSTQSFNKYKIKNSSNNNHRNDGLLQ